jgi:hypothetical protein
MKMKAFFRMGMKLLLALASGRAREAVDKLRTAHFLLF